MRRRRSTPTRTRAAARGYGWNPDTPDFRDHPYLVARRVARALPRSADLRGQASPVEDQGQLGSCTANALVGALEFLERKEGEAVVDLSRLFIYYNERAVERTIASDSGAQLRDGIKTLAKLGVCAEAEWPYVISTFTRKPSQACYRDARRHVITSYQRLATIDDMRGCLADGFPFVFGFTVYEAFESAAVARSGVLGMPKSRERSLGGHAVCAMGYDDRAKRFLVRNSWGAGWGQRGYFTMPYDYVADRNLSDDFWTIRR